MIKGKDWDMEDFQKPEGKGVLKQTGKVKQKSEDKTGRIIVYMPKSEEIKMRKQAKDLGLSAASFIRLQLKKNN